MDFDDGKTLFLGINKDGDLVSLELSFNDLNKGTKFYNPHYYLNTQGFTDIKDEETGEQEARERLEDWEYWEEIGYLSDNIPPVLRNNIDFKEVAEDVINNDGWEMTNGEFYFIGTYKDKNYYINLNWCGFEEEAFNRELYKNIFVSEEDFKFLSSVKEIKETDEENVLKLKTIFSKYQDKKPIIEKMLEEHESD